jgi:hypothetical protein
MLFPVYSVLSVLMLLMLQVMPMLVPTIHYEVDWEFWSELEICLVCVCVHKFSRQVSLDLHFDAGVCVTLQKVERPLCICACKKTCGQRPSLRAAVPRPISPPGQVDNITWFISGTSLAFSAAGYSTRVLIGLGTHG